MNARMQGAFLGLAVGDCLGAPVEGMPAWEIKKRFGRITELLDPFEVWVRRPERGRLRGLHTDDTQQAWIVADVLLRHGLAPDRVADRFVAFAAARPDLPRGVHRGTGRAFRAAVERLAHGTPPFEAGEPSGSNGAAMRVAPLGLAFAGRRGGFAADAGVADLAREVVRFSAITHRDARAIEAAAGVAALLAALVGDAPPAGLRPMVEAAIAGARAAEEALAAGEPIALPAAARAQSGAFREVLAQLLVRADLPDEELGREIANLASAHSPGRKIKRANDGFALASVPAAIVCAARASDFRGCLESGVSAGEDADSVGAIAGALAGARFGAAAIPSEWLSALVAIEPLQRVAARLAGGDAELPDQEPLEEAWTRAERQEAVERARLQDEEDEAMDEDEDSDEEE